MKKFEDNKIKEQGSAPYDVLIISENATTIRLITSYFEMSGYTCKGLDSGSKALKDMQTNVPRFIIMDKILHDLSGYDILTELKSDERLKNIILTFFSEKSPQKNKEISKKSFEDYGGDVVDFFKF